MSGMCRDCGEFFGSQNGLCSQCVLKEEHGGPGEIIREDVAKIRIEEARERREEEQVIIREEERLAAIRRREDEHADDLTKNQKLLVLFGAGEAVKIAAFALLCLFGWNWGGYLCIWVGIIYCCCFGFCNFICIPCCSLIGLPCGCCECCTCWYSCTIPLAACGLFCFIAGPFLTLCAPLVFCIPNPALFVWFVPDFDELNLDDV